MKKVCKCMEKETLDDNFRSNKMNFHHLSLSMTVFQDEESLCTYEIARESPFYK